MGNKPAILCLTACLLLVACDPQQAAHQHTEREVLSYTHYTPTTELFVEFAPLVVGQPSRLAAHLTWLANFTPVTSGSVDVLLQKNGKTLARFRVAVPTRAGLFTPEITARDAGTFELAIVLSSEGLTSQHNLGSITVFPSAEAVKITQAEPEGDIHYSKEQQWQSRFATVVAEPQPIRPSVPGFASVLAPADGGADIPAPGDGYFAAVDLVRAGDTVAAGDLLGYLVPRLGEGSDLGESLVALARARSELQLSERDVERLRPLVKQGAVAERRLQEAQQTFTVAQAQWRAANARVEQRQTGSGKSGIALRAPVTGEVIEVRALPGVFVRSGQRIFRIATPERRWLQIQIPEHFASDLHDVSGAWFDYPAANNQTAPQVLDTSTGAKLVQVSSAIESNTRTASVTIEYPASAGPTSIGSRFAARVYTQAAEERLAIPRSAVIDDGGLPVVYVQTGGEIFVRRAVDLGLIDGPLVEVLNGLTNGERVVSEGAYTIKLASIGGSDIGHGHAH